MHTFSFKKINPWIVLSAVLLFAMACKRWTEEPGPDAATTTFTIQGESYEITGFGGATLEDDFFIAFAGTGPEPVLDTVNYDSFLGFSINRSTKQEDFYFTFSITNYDGPGTYPFMNRINKEYGGLVEILFHNLNVETTDIIGYSLSIIGQEEGVGTITITKDDGEEIEGSFIVEVFESYNMDDTARYPMAGTFSGRYVNE
jgi:hypothetical protein